METKCRLCGREINPKEEEEVSVQNDDMLVTKAQIKEYIAIKNDKAFSRWVKKGLPVFRIGREYRASKARLSEWVRGL